MSNEKKYTEVSLEYISGGGKKVKLEGLVEKEIIITEFLEFFTTLMDCITGGGMSGGQIMDYIEEEQKKWEKRREKE